MNAPKKIYWDVQDRIADENKDDPNEIPYIRADIVDELVEALSEMLTYAADLNPMQSYDDEHDHSAVKQARAALAKLEESHD